MSYNEVQLSELAKTIRGLSIDAIQAANSGHPGLPLGCAEIAAYLYGHALRHNPKNPHWVNRDRFVLSAGHGSMLLYSALHLSGYDVSLDTLKNFRQLNSPTAGHPEYKELPGIETTTGPLGQGVAMAVGMAFGQKIAKAQHQVPLDNTTYVLVGDGCLMEGISAEASSFAGHLELENLVVIYDSNDICLDGPTSECFTEDVAKRYESYGWDVQTINGHAFTAIDKAISHTKTTKKPSLIIAKTTIGFGSPNKAGSNASHGAPLGSEEIKLTKKGLGIPDIPFWIAPSLSAYFETRNAELSKLEKAWNSEYESWSTQNPEKSASYHLTLKQTFSAQQKESLKDIALPEGKATRATSNSVIQHISKELPYILGGSADLSCSDSTFIKEGGVISAKDFSGRNVKYGVREFAMGAIASGLVLQGNFRPFVGTFMTFSDYMKNAIRLAALMNIGVIYQFTHDSILLGEDGPTHQPVEHLASLRSIPNLTVIRPADTTEVKAAWATAIEAQGPVALILSRQGVPENEGSNFEEAQKGAYIVKKESKKPELILLATGSELSLALESAVALESEGKSVRVVSMPSWELFDAQDKHYQSTLLPLSAKYAVIEAQSSFGWHKYVGREGVCITVDTFGKSAPIADLKKVYGFNVDAICKKINTDLY